MCGIFGCVSTSTDAAQRTLNGLKQLEYRGYDSWGVAYADSANGQISIQKQKGKIGDAVLGAGAESANVSIGHTRWATHGGITVENAHPHLSADKTYAVVHNGIIENHQQLRTELLAKGYVFQSQTDTEVFVHLLAEELKNASLTEAVHRAFAKVHGLNAFVILSLRANKLVAVRHGSPLAIGKSETEFLIASDSTAMGPTTHSVYYLADDEMVVHSQDGTRLYDAVSMHQKILNWQKYTFVEEDLGKGQYAHFLLKEIHEQPRVLRSVVTDLGASIERYASSLQKDLYFSGCGTAYHAALTGTYFLSLIAKRHAQAIAGTEFKYLRDLLTKDSTITFLSQSGETIDIVEHLPYLEAHGIPTAAIVNRLGSTLERNTKNKVLLPAGPEQAVLATKSYVAKVAVVFLTAHALAGTLETGMQQLLQSIKAVEKILQPEYTEQHVTPVVEKLVDARDIFLIGRGVSYPLAMESALKIKEVTYIHAEGFAGGELKHGVISLIEEGTPCIVFAPEDGEYDSIISNATELKVRGAFIIGVSSKPSAIFDVYLPVEDAGLLSSITQIVVMQLVAYHLALKLGRDADKPRNLAKSVTVK